ncbi:MAG: class I SAM-dependent methyltransferase [bacterium]
MKKYENVVNDRYNSISSKKHIYEDIYSVLNPIGFWTYIEIETLICKFFNTLRNEHIDITKFKILDIGCGSGTITRLFAEITKKPQNITGIDLSEVRLKEAKELNQSIKYEQHDIVNLPVFSEKFDVISAFVVFMHLNTEEQILKAMQGIKTNLAPNGYFVWYDVYSKDHFKSPKNVDSWGFSGKQMDYLCSKAGFKKVSNLNIFKTFFGKIHSLTLCKIFPVWFVKILEKIIPSKAGNMCRIYKIDKQ